MQSASLICRIFLVWVGVGLVVGKCAAADATVAISYRILPSDLTAGEPVFLTVNIENPLDEVVMADVGMERYRAKITLPDGKQQAAAGSLFRLISARNHVSIQPRNSLTETLLLNKWVSFIVPGRYILDIQFEGNLTTSGGLKLQSPLPGHVYIDISPLAPTRLQGICRDLEQKVQEANSYDAAVGPAEALSYVGDPVAIPYLARLLEAGKLLETQAIQGLERLATSSAVNVLISHLMSPSQDTRDLVRAALMRIDERTSDGEISAQIRAVGLGH